MSPRSAPQAPRRRQDHAPVAAAAAPRRGGWRRDQAAIHLAPEGDLAGLERRRWRIFAARRLPAAQDRGSRVRAAFAAHDPGVAMCCEACVLPRGRGCCRRRSARRRRRAGHRAAPRGRRSSRGCSSSTVERWSTRPRTRSPSGAPSDGSDRRCRAPGTFGRSVEGLRQHSMARQARSLPAKARSTADRGGLLARPAGRNDAGSVDRRKSRGPPPRAATSACAAARSFTRTNRMSPPSRRRLLARRRRCPRDPAPPVISPSSSGSSTVPAPSSPPP